ncbi:hypothetical protein EYC84_010042 [Monilinia fructicola]|uniref:DUF3824 domain-containing protein n=1 Tax=Monilinia fructicola TaxID=38448 RepID=A0A5M9JGT6_MONFR|nr:hypothetical protein EYC84_010042 [Monilinia fructicola]
MTVIKTKTPLGIHLKSLKSGQPASKTFYRRKLKTPPSTIMTTYDYEYETVDEPRRHRSHRHRKDDREPRYTDEARYVETQETYVRSAAPAKSSVAYAPDAPIRERERETTQTRELVRQPRREDSDLSIEEVRRDFPPPAGSAYVDQRTTVREARYKKSNTNDRFHATKKIAAAVGGAALAVGAKELWDRRSAEGRPVERNPLASAMVGAAGAFAAYEGTELYEKHGNKEKKVKKYAAHRGRNGEVQESYYSDEEDIKPEKKKGRRKSIVEGRRAAEAFRVRNEPGAWGGEKGKRILTAAIGAGSIDAAIDRDADKKSKRHILEAVVGGLVGNRAINGSRKEVEEDPVTGRSRSRSRARSSSRGGGGGGGTGLAALATAGLGAIAGKKLLDRSRSRSRARSQSRGRRDSYSRSPSADRSKRSRSKSVSSMARKGLAALGIGAGAGAAANEISRSRDRSRSRNRDNYDDYDSYDDHPRRSKGQRGDVYGNPRYADSRGSVDGRGGRARDGQRNKKVAEGKNGYDSDDSLISSSEDERRVKKMKARSHRH